MKCRKLEDLKAVSRATGIPSTNKLRKINTSGSNSPPPPAHPLYLLNKIYLKIKFSTAAGISPVPSRDHYKLNKINTSG